MNSDKNIEELFRQQSRKQELQPSIQTWDKIRYEMQRKKSKRKIYFYQAISAACVVVIGLSIAAFVFINKFGNVPVETDNEISQEEIDWEKESELIQQNQDGDLAITNVESVKEETEPSIVPEVREEKELQEIKSANKDRISPSSPPPAERVYQDAKAELSYELDENLEEVEVASEPTVSTPKDISTAKVATPNYNRAAGIQVEKKEADKNIEQYDEVAEVEESEDALLDEVVTVGYEKARKKRKNQNEIKQYKITKRKLKFFGNELVYTLKSKEGNLVVYETREKNYPQTISFDLEQNIILYKPNHNNIETNTLKSLIQMNQADILNSIQSNN